MSSGGYIQLQLFGAENAPLNENPEITFFRQVARKSVAFSQDAIELAWSGVSDFNRRCTCTLGKSGDLVTECFVEIVLPDLAEYNPPMPNQSDVNPIVYDARYTGDGTTATIKCLRILGSTTEEFTATCTSVADGTTVTATVTGQTGTTVIIPVEGLDLDHEYNVVVEQDGVASPETEVFAMTWQNSIGHVIAESIELECGGARIDYHTSEFLEIMSLLTTPEEKKEGLDKMIGRFPVKNFNPRVDGIRGERTLMVPLRFFFNTPSMALPLLALTYHDVKFNFSIRPFKECIKTTRKAITSMVDSNGQPITFKSIRVFANYIYLDTDQRRKYIANANEQLVTCMQYLGPVVIEDTIDPGNNPVKKIPIDFSHPVKELLFVYVPPESFNGDSTTYDWFNFGHHYDDEDFFTELKLQINGNDRCAYRTGEFFKFQQIYSHHTRVPDKNIYCYSFALYPELPSGSGTCNYSRIQTSHIVAKLRPGVQKGGRIMVFATSFNLFRVANGLGGLAFAGN
jgi:hypothetical protein